MARSAAIKSSRLPLEAPQPRGDLIVFGQVRGTHGDDSLHGSRGPDTIDGLGGDDLLKGRDGNDALNGGKGDDVLKGSGDATRSTAGPATTGYTAERNSRMAHPQAETISMAAPATTTSMRL